MYCIQQPLCPASKNQVGVYIVIIRNLQKNIPFTYCHIEMINASRIELCLNLTSETFFQTMFKGNKAVLEFLLWLFNQSCTKFQEGLCRSSHTANHVAQLVALHLSRGYIFYLINRFSIQCKADVNAIFTLLVFSNLIIFY